MSSTYTGPVAKLLTYGDCHDSRTWPDYAELGLTPAHISELIKMATDEKLLRAESDGLEVWAPIHAWRTLGELHSEEAIEPLLRLFHEHEHSDWVGEELPIVFGMIGPKALHALAHYLADDSHGTFARVTAAHGLERIGNAYPEANERCRLALTEQLERFQNNDPTLNGLLIGYLTDLKAAEALPVVKQAFDNDSVDLMVVGDLEDVEIEFQVRQHRSTPRPLSPLQKQLAPLVEQLSRLQRPMTRKIGRNEPCPCGSGRKYKRCCLNNR